VGEKRTWSVPVYTFATTAVDFITDIDPVTDPDAFKEAFDNVGFDFPTANLSNDFELAEWEISCKVDGTPDVWIPKDE
jgi:hypothetical protein